MQLVIVTGMSGAGKSRVIDSLEDIGFFCVDNMTPKLIPTFVQLLNDSAEIREKVAIVADVRLGGSFSSLFSALDELKSMECEYKVLFIDADIRRLSCTSCYDLLEQRWGVYMGQNSGCTCNCCVNISKF